MQRKLNDEFIREYSEEFSEKVTSAFFEDNKKISGKEILSVTPSKQVNFFVLKILFRKWQEEMKKLESPFFNYKSTEVRKAMVQFMNTLSQHIELGQDHLTPMLEEAVADTLLLAADPGSYLSMEFEALDVPQINEKLTKPIQKYLRLHKTDVQLFFDENNEVSLDDFLDSAESFFEDLDTAEVVANELALLSEVLPIAEDELYLDHEGFHAQDDEDDLDDDVPDITDELDEPALLEDGGGDEAGEDTESEERKESFFEERHEDEPAAAEPIEEDWEDEPEEEDPYDGESDEEDEPERDEHERDEHEDEPTGEDDGVSEDEVSETQESTGAAESLNDQLANVRNTVNDTYNEERGTLADHLQRDKVTTIMEAISVNHRYMFTKELFEGDREAFASAIADIEGCTSFDDAVELLVQTYAKERAWDMNSDEVKELLKVIFRKFR